MICSSLCRVPFIPVLLSWVAENSHSRWSSFWGLGQIGLFGTTIKTPDNVQTIVRNNKILSDNIQNFWTNTFHRVDLTAQIAHEMSHAEAHTPAQNRVSKNSKCATAACT